MEELGPSTVCYSSALGFQLRSDRKARRQLEYASIRSPEISLVLRDYSIQALLTSEVFSMDLSRAFRSCTLSRWRSKLHSGKPAWSRRI